jgi:hypothetical protein
VQTTHLPNVVLETKTPFHLLPLEEKMPSVDLRIENLTEFEPNP